MSEQQIDKAKDDKTKGSRNKWTPEIIINKGKKLFREKGFELSMHDIARELNTRASSLYRHVDSKRELWFALTDADFRDFSRLLDKTTRKHLQSGNKQENSSLQLLKKMGHAFLNFAKEDFYRFQLMYLFEPPKLEEGKKVGPYEAQCNPDSLTGLVNLCELVINEQQLKRITGRDLALQMLSFVLGFSILRSPINDYLLEKNEFQDIRSSNYQDFMLESAVDSFINNYR